MTPGALSTLAYWQDWCEEKLATTDAAKPANKDFRSGNVGPQASSSVTPNTRLGREPVVTATPGDHVRIFEEDAKATELTILQNVCVDLEGDNFCEVPEEDDQNAKGAIPLQWRSVSRGGVYGLILDKEDDEQKLSVRDGGKGAVYEVLPLRDNTMLVGDCRFGAALLLA
ncbi:hypothetical protein PI125_g9548 [Phytophthora idaei]|nr:hypothetical protein PI125_g9548 [Phytophthora idaei]